MLPLAIGAEIGRGVIGCKCRTWPHPNDASLIMVSGESDCPIHGFGANRKQYFKVGEQEIVLTASTRQYDPYKHETWEYAQQQKVILRVYHKTAHETLQMTALYWLSGYKALDPETGSRVFVSPSLAVEVKARRSKRAKGISTSRWDLESADGQRLSRRWLKSRAAMIADALDVPVGVVLIWAERYSYQWTHYILNGE